MQVIQSVVASDEECLALFNICKDILEAETSPAYSDEEKVDLLSNKTKEFKSLLADYIHEAFTIGINEGVKSAAAKDTPVFKPMAPLRS
jgi:hypothetical protein